MSLFGRKKKKTSYLQPCSVRQTLHDHDDQADRLSFLGVNVNQSLVQISLVSDLWNLGLEAYQVLPARQNKCSTQDSKLVWSTITNYVSRTGLGTELSP